jgi:hypothetical protein
MLFGIASIVHDNHERFGLERGVVCEKKMGGAKKCGAK